MSKNVKILLGVLVLVLIVGSAAFMYSKSEDLEGKFSLRFDEARVMDTFPDFKCDDDDATVVVSRVISEVSSTFGSGSSTGSTSGETSGEVSEVTSLVPYCMPIKKFNRFEDIWRKN